MIPTLTELAFTGRNRAYGAFQIYRRYPRTLLISLVAGLLILFSSVMAPFLYYYVDPVPLVEGDILYDAAYYAMMAPPEEPDLIIPSAARPLPEVNTTPVVTDTVKVNQPNPLPEKRPEEEEKRPADTAQGTGKGNGFGPGSSEESGLATVIDVYPKYPGGDEARLYYIRKNTRYPDAAVKAAVQGVVMVVFIIEMDGSLSNIEVSNGIGSGCDEEAMRIVRGMPRWEPAKRAGRPVRLLVRMPIVFRIPGK